MTLNLNKRRWNSAGAEHSKSNEKVDRLDGGIEPELKAVSEAAYKGKQLTATLVGGMPPEKRSAPASVRNVHEEPALMEMRNAVRRMLSTRDELYEKLDSELGTLADLALSLESELVYVEGGHPLASGGDVITSLNENDPPTLDGISAPYCTKLEEALRELQDAQKDKASAVESLRSTKLEFGMMRKFIPISWSGKWFQSNMRCSSRSLTMGNSFRHNVVLDSSRDGAEQCDSLWRRLSEAPEQSWNI